jgi:exopolysaccharide biosynthesis predicted pyruvyltransferase EpsI
VNLQSVQAIKDKLHESIKNIGDIEECVLLGYPNHKNTGDRLIWLGNLQLLNSHLKVKIRYVASNDSYSDTELSKYPNIPIILHGGGNMGDLWRDHQIFKERIILRFQDRKIVIFPQTIYFKSKKNLENAAIIFNNHPDLTIFVRDKRSYQIGKENFYNCKVFQSPDTAFQLFNTFDMPHYQKNNNSILALIRDDFEKNLDSTQSKFKGSKFSCEDWSPFENKWLLSDGIRAKLKQSKNFTLGDRQFRLVQLLAYVYREFWQRGILTPEEFTSKYKWLRKHPYNEVFNQIDKPSLHYLCLSFMHSGIYQILQHKLIITNRLHGHILCSILGKSHIFLPNSYYKNEGFYQAWTSNVPFCRFVKNPSELDDAIQSLDGKQNVTELSTL